MNDAEVPRPRAGTTARGFLVALTTIAFIRGPGRNGRRTALVLVAALAVSCPLTAATIVVTASNDLQNGDTSNPWALALNPGPDGISLREAILSANNAPGPHTIIFSSSLAGGTILLTNPGGLPAITRNGVTIAGPAGANPTLTIDGSGMLPCCGGGVGAILSVAASDVTISGLRIINASFTAVVVETNDGITSLARLTFTHNEFVDDASSMIIIMASPGDQVFSDITIAGNVFRRTKDGNDIYVNQRAGAGLAGPLRLVNLRVEDNTFQSTSTGLAAHAIGVGMNIGAVQSEISGVTIARNSFVGYNARGNPASDTDAVLLAAQCADCVSQGLRIHDNHFSQTTFPMELAAAGGSGGRVAHAEFLGNTVDTSGQPISLGTFNTASGTRIEDVLIEDNVFLGNRNPSVAVLGGAGTSANTIRDISIVNNLIAGASPGGGIIITGGHGGGTNNSVAGVRIVNNTIANNAGTGIIVSRGDPGNGVSDVSVTNTILWGNAWDFGGDAVPPYSFCLTSTSPNPRFVDPASGNYHLQAGSPAIDAGTSAGAPLQDIEYRLRSNPDIGAYEFNGVAATRRRWVTVIKGGAGDGVVTGAPIDCGSTCRVEVQDGTTLTLTATATPSSEFTGWNGDCTGTGPCTITATADMIAIATFRPATVSLTVSKAGAGAGTVASTPAGLSCGAKCSARVVRGMLATLRATAAPGSIFSHWSGACSGSGDCTIAMDGDNSATATFDIDGPCTAPSAPIGVAATAVSATSVWISWNAAPGSGSMTYQIQRSETGTSGFTDLPGATTTGTTFTDATALANRSYLYRVVAGNACGNATSAYDLSTVVSYSDDPLIAGSTVVSAAHLMELRTAVNAVRALAGLPPMTFTDPVPAGIVIKAAHVTELRGSVGLSGLDQAMAILGLATGAFSAAVSPGAVVHAVDIQELRNRMR